MDLSFKDVVDLFQVSEKTILQWIEEKKLPAYKIKNQYRFNKAEINEWILRNKIDISEKILDLNLTSNPVSIIDLVKKGGIHYSIKGNNIDEIINNLVNTIPIPPETTKETVVSALLKREEMMTTAVGKGIAFPHPRTPIIADVENESISICFLDTKIDYKALDGELVQILFVIISANPKRHLEILSKISFLCQQEDFIQILYDQAKKDVILYYIENKEKQWSKR